LVSASQFVQLDQPCLVDVDEALALTFGVIELALQADDLAGEELVVGDRLATGHGGLAGGEQLGAEHGSADLVVDQGVELVGADLALLAAPVWASCFELVVVGAGVVVVVTAAAGWRPGAAALDPAWPADDQTSRQPAVGGRPAGAECAVVAGYALCGVEGVGGDDCWHRHLDPFFFGAAHLTRRWPVGRVEGTFSWRYQYALPM
jgi:hypothetical protein